MRRLPSSPRCSRFIGELHSYVHSGDSQLQQLSPEYLTSPGRKPRPSQGGTIQFRWGCEWPSRKKYLRTDLIYPQVPYQYVPHTKPNFAGTTPATAGHFLWAGWLARSQANLVKLNAHLRHVLENENNSAAVSMMAIVVCGDHKAVTGQDRD